MLLSQSTEYCLSTALSESLKADHGFNVESRAIRDLIEIMADYDQPTRREYLQFITGSPKLPIGGKLYLFAASLQQLTFPLRFPRPEPAFDSCAETS